MSMLIRDKQMNKHEAFLFVHTHKINRQNVFPALFEPQKALYYFSPHVQPYSLPAELANFLFNCLLT